MEAHRVGNLGPRPWEWQSSVLRFRWDLPKPLLKSLACPSKKLAPELGISVLHLGPIWIQQAPWSEYPEYHHRDELFRMAPNIQQDE